MGSELLEQGNAALDAQSAIGDRRRGSCRRRPLHQAEWRWILGGRRRAMRRSEDAADAHTDWYPLSLLLVAIGTLLLSTMDAALTLVMIRQGIVVEANPLMAALVEIDPRVFINVKLAMTGISLIFLVIYARFSLFGSVSIRLVMYALFGFYVVLVGYEIACGLAFGAFFP